MSLRDVLPLCKYEEFRGQKHDNPGSITSSGKKKSGKESRSEITVSSKVQTRSTLAGCNIMFALNGEKLRELRYENGGKTRKETGEKRRGGEK